MTMSGRTSRSKALARFRKTRLDRRDHDFEERSSMILKVAADVADLITATREDLHQTTAERMAWSQELHGALDGFRSDLAAANAAFMSETGTARAEQGAAALAARQQFLDDLREDVERIVTEDFGLTSATSPAEPGFAFDDDLPAEDEMSEPEDEEPVDPEIKKKVRKALAA